jgi:hypothetical protein
VAPPHYVKVDSLFSTVFVPFDEEYAVYFDHAMETLSDSLVPCVITLPALQVLDLAPDWMREDLRWNLSLMTPANQDRYAALALGVGDPIRDEVLFQVAHLSWNVLSNPNWDETVPVENAQLLYTNDQSLGYVQINDYPGPGYYSTTEYTFIEGASPVRIEIPRDIYCWFVVMPKLSDEPPLQDATVYNSFWREYLFTYADPTFPLPPRRCQPAQRSGMAPHTIQEARWTRRRPSTWSRTGSAIPSSRLPGATGRYSPTSSPTSTTGTAAKRRICSTLRPGPA